MSKEINDLHKMNNEVVKKVKITLNEFIETVNKYPFWKEVERQLIPLSDVSKFKKSSNTVLKSFCCLSDGSDLEIEVTIKNTNTDFVKVV